MGLRIPQRFDIIGAYWKCVREGREVFVSLPRLLRYLMLPGREGRAMGYITRIEDAGDYEWVYLSPCKHPLYWPKEFGRSCLYDLVSQQFHPQDWHRYQIPQTRVEADDTVADCGAAEGLFSLAAADHCKKVYAFEPLPMLVEAMRRTFEPMPNVEVVAAGASDQTGQSFLTEAGVTSTVGSVGTVAISLTSLDDFFLSRDIPLTYLKADIEGHEMAMLAGAREVIRKHKPKIAITTYHNLDDYKDIGGFLKEAVPEYQILVRGMDFTGAPMMLHAWIP